MNTLADWEAHLEALTPPSEIRLGLDRVALVWARLDDGSPRRVVTVAGTNGKGSVVEVAGVLADAAGCAYGQYTSPHLHSVRERIRVQGDWVSEADLVAALNRVESARDEIPLTYFETLTLAAFVVFQQKAVSLWILEIGLGGRLDAVNVIDPDVSVITHIGWDHQDFLGNTLPAIAREKAGIMREGRPCFTAAMPVLEALTAAAEASGAALSTLESYCNSEGQLHTSQGWVSYRHVQLPPDSVGLAILAIDAIECLPSEPLETLLETARVPGRMTERWIDGVRWVLDVGHNVDACRFVTETLKQADHATERWVICGLLADKDAQAIAPILTEYADRVVLVGLSGPRGRSADALSEEWERTTGQTPWRTFATLHTAIDALGAELADGAEVLVMGSFILVADALTHEHFN